MMTAGLSDADGKARATGKDVPVGGIYAKYALAILIIVYVFNFVDRQILSILAQNIKADLGVSDAQIGFLYGTSFAIFYALFGIPLGRLADLWTRKNLIALGLTLWSAMTALSGSARGFLSLATFRVGVGIGEASASPAAYSLLTDYFSKKRRTTALGLYSSGAYIGQGFGIFLGGAILDTWNRWYPDPSLAPLGLKGWQAAFLAVGLPGLIMALWVATMREPRRGQSDGLMTPPHPHPFREAFSELMAILPGLNFVHMARMGAPAKLYVRNIAAAIGFSLAAWVLISATGGVLQWTALALGLYCTVSWAIVFAAKDPETFDMIFRCRTIVLSCVGFATIAFCTYGVTFWLPPYCIRAFGAGATQVGGIIGFEAAVGGWIGISMASYIADRWREHSVRGNLYVGFINILFTAALAVTILQLRSLTTFYLATFFYCVLSSMWIGPVVSLVTSLVLPQARALAGAMYVMAVTLLGLALGPYLMGYFSDLFTAGGSTPSEGLRWGIMTGLLTLIVGAACLLAAMRTITQDEATYQKLAEAVRRKAS